MAKSSQQEAMYLCLCSLEALPIAPQWPKLIHLERLRAALCQDSLRASHHEGGNSPFAMAEGG